MCDLALRFGETGTGDKTILSRPFGVALLIAGVDELGAHLYFADPSGTFTKYKAKAIGSAAEAAQNTLQDEYKPEITVAEAEKLAIKILKEVMEEKINSVNVQLASVTAAGFHIYSEAEVNGLLNPMQQ